MKSDSLLFRVPPATKAKLWSAHDLLELRKLAMQGIALEAIAAQLRRTISSVRNKAAVHGISLRRPTLTDGEENHALK